MKIERVLYGMFNGKICMLKTTGVNNIITDKNLQHLRELTVADSDKYLWLPTEQVVALPHIESVEDKDGRSWVQNQTLLIPIHDYIRLTSPYEHFAQHFLPVMDTLPIKFEPLTVTT